MWTDRGGSQTTLIDHKDCIYTGVDKYKTFVSLCMLVMSEGNANADDVEPPVIVVSVKQFCTAKLNPLKVTSVYLLQFL
jgi:hypothetical protein